MSNNSLEQFIAAARSKGMPDDHIAGLLKANGWDQQQIELALTGLIVPVPERTNRMGSLVLHGKSNEKSIGQLEAALQHILLWVFTGASTIMFAVVSAAMFGADSAPTDTLKTYFAIELITFIPFAVLFAHYVRAFRKQTDLKTGRIWSIITVVLHSVGLTSSLITVVLALLLIDEADEKTAVAIGGVAIGLINGFVVATYVAANFAKNTTDRLRNAFIMAFPAALGVITLIFGVYCLVQFAPIRKDEATRKNLHTIVDSVREYTKDNKRLPERLEDTSIDEDILEGVTYVLQSNATTEYKLCAVFQRDTAGEYYEENYEIGDDYVSDYDFTETKKGKECFVIHASELGDTDYY